MNLPIHQKQAIDLLPDNAKAVIAAIYNGRKLSDMPEPSAKAEILKSVTRALAEANRQSKDPQYKVILVNAIYSDLNGKLKNLTIEKLDLVLKEGVRGEFGDFVDITITTVHKWVKAFDDSELKKTSLNYYNLLLSQETKKPEPTPEEQETILKNAANEAYKRFKETGELPAAAVGIYKWIKRTRGIVWTQAEREQIEKEALLNYKLKQKEDNPLKKIEIGDGLKDEKKRVALKYYFIKLKNVK